MGTILGTDFNHLTGSQRKILRETLIGVFGGRKNLDLFLDENDFGRFESFVSDADFDTQVFEFISKLYRAGKLARLMTLVGAAFPDAPAILDLEDRLSLTDGSVEQQRVLGQQGLEVMVRKAGFDDLESWVNDLLAAGRRVCCIQYPVGDGVATGTGFLVARDCVLTNFHVIEPLLKNGLNAHSVGIRFGYAIGPSGSRDGTTHRLAADWKLDSLPYSATDVKPGAGFPGPEELDFALLRLASQPGDDEGPDGPRGWFDLASAAAPSVGSIVFILQHPAGEPLKQSIGMMQKSASPYRLRYDADTLGGSSGAIVLGEKLRPLALHHAGAPGSLLNPGYNQGIPLPLIDAALKARGTTW